MRVCFRIAVAEADTVASVVQKVIDKEQLEFALPAMYRLVRCGNASVTRDGSEPVRATLPRSGVVDVLTRTVGDYAIVDGDILAMQVSPNARRSDHATSCATACARVGLEVSLL